MIAQDYWNHKCRGLKWKCLLSRVLRSPPFSSRFSFLFSFLSFVLLVSIFLSIAKKKKKKWPDWYNSSSFLLFLLLSSFFLLLSSFFPVFHLRISQQALSTHSGLFKLFFVLPGCHWSATQKKSKEKKRKQRDSNKNFARFSIHFELIIEGFCFVKGRNDAWIYLVALRSPIFEEFGVISLLILASSTCKWWTCPPLPNRLRLLSIADMHKSNSQYLRAKWRKICQFFVISEPLCGDNWDLMN